MSFVCCAKKARLEFLMFALTNSSLGLAEAHVDLLWRVLVEEALTPEAAGEDEMNEGELRMAWDPRL